MIEVRVVAPSVEVKVRGQRAQVSTGTPVAREYVDLPAYTGSYNVTPGASVQTLATQNKRMTGNVTVQAVPGDYVGPSVPRQSQLSTDGPEVTAAAGYYENPVSETVQSGSVTTPDTEITANPAISVSAVGKVTASVSASDTVQPSVSPGWVNEAGSGDIDVTGSAELQLSTQEGKTVTPTTSEQTAVAAGKYTTGAVKVGPIPPEYIIPAGTLEITQNGDGIDVSAYAEVDVAVPGASPNLQDRSVSYTPSETAQSETVTAMQGYDGLDEVSVSVAAIPSNYVGSGVTRRSSSDLSGSGATITAPAGYYAQSASKSVPSGTEGTPTAAKSAVSNHAVTITPSVTNSEGYISGGTKNGTAVTVQASELVSGTLAVDSAGTKDVTNYATASVPSADANGVVSGRFVTESGVRKFRVTGTGYVESAGWVDDGEIQPAAHIDYDIVPANTTITPSATAQTIGAANTMLEGPVTIAAMPSGTAGTPTATKGTVSNHSVSVTPSVTNTTGYITGGTKTGTAVTVTAAELVSGSETKTENGTYDVTNLASLVVNVSGGSSDVATGTLTVASNVSTSANTAIATTSTIGFTPTKFFFWKDSRTATNNHVHQATFTSLGSYYIRTMTRYSSNALSTSGNTNNWTTQTAGYLYFNSNTVYFRSSSSYILSSGTWHWVAVK